MKRRVVVTGIAGISPLGNDWENIRLALLAYKNAVQVLPEWEQYTQLNPRLGAPAAPFDVPPAYDREKTRSMGRVALMAARASELALIDAGLKDDALMAAWVSLTVLRCPPCRPPPRIGKW